MKTKAIKEEITYFEQRTSFPPKCAGCRLRCPSNGRADEGSRCLDSPIHHADVSHQHIDDAHCETKSGADVSVAKLGTML